MSKVKTILQLSDFHIKMEMGKPRDNSTFCKLVEFIKGICLENIIFVYNGDIIDSRCIMDGNPDSLSAPEKSKIWKEKATESYKLAKEYFSYFTAELGIPNDRIIICCGNHDINQNAIGVEKVSCDYMNVTYDNERFSLIRQFTDDIVLKKDTYQTHLRKIDGINFLVINSNWSIRAMESFASTAILSVKYLGKTARH